VQYVFTSMLIYFAMAIDIPAWGWKAVDKFRRSFFWRGSADAKGGYCQVAWCKVCRPMELGGLRISSLQELGWALRMRWMWLQKTDPNRPWAALSIQIPTKAKSFFSVAMQVEIGDGSGTLFWQDRWLHGQRIADFAPRLLAAVPKNRINKCTIQEALCANKWVSDIRGAITVGVMVEYLQLWEVLLNVELQLGHQDTHFWRFTANKQYSAKATYEGLLWGSVEFEHYERVWKT
jgi:hypothetical protein